MKDGRWKAVMKEGARAGTPRKKRTEQKKKDKTKGKLCGVRGVDWLPVVCNERSRVGSSYGRSAVVAVARGRRRIGGKLQVLPRISSFVSISSFFFHLSCATRIYHLSGLYAFFFHRSSFIFLLSFVSGSISSVLVAAGFLASRRSLAAAGRASRRRRRPAGSGALGVRRRLDDNGGLPLDVLARAAGPRRREGDGFGWSRLHGRVEAVHWLEAARAAGEPRCCAASRCSRRPPVSWRRGAGVLASRRLPWRAARISAPRVSWRAAGLSSAPRRRSAQSRPRSTMSASAGWLAGWAGTGWG